MAIPILPLGSTPDGWMPSSRMTTTTTTAASGDQMEEVVGGVEIRSQYNWTVQSREVETCGLAFFQYLRSIHDDDEEGGGGGDGKGGGKRRKKGGKTTSMEVDDDEEDDDDDENNFRFPEKALTEDDIEDMDYYTLLGLGHLAMRADQDLIKKAYRKALLLYHPDKTGRGDRDEVFIQVQKAYETLSDERKKRAYDSELDFDDSIPTGRERGDFFTVYGPVFQRNARFATKRPVPQLGSKDSSIDDVYRFYEYWTRFESWRDFSLKAAEHNLEEAGSREEKRWMQKENDKRARNMKKDEYKRLATLVERAKVADPRLANAKEAEKKMKEELKQARLKEKQKKEEEARLAAELEQKRKDEEEARLKEERAQAKAVRDIAKNRMRMARSRFRAQCQMLRDHAHQGQASKTISSEDEELVLEVMDVEEMEKAVASLGGDGDIVVKGVDLVLKMIADQRKATDEKAKEEEEAKRVAMEKQQQQLQAQAAAQAAAKERPWSEDELGTLAKAVIKFPAGTQKRWQCIADFINHMLKLSDLRTKEECIKQYQQVQAAPGKSGAIGGGPPKPTTTTTVIGAAGGAGGITSPKGGGAGGSSLDGSGSGARVVKVEASSEEDVWTQDQQKQLEAGLVKHPASLEKNERWKLIAEGVEGKSKKQCIERYKTLRAAIQQKKKG